MADDIKSILECHAAQEPAAPGQREHMLAAAQAVYSLFDVLPPPDQGEPLAKIWYALNNCWAIAHDKMVSGGSLADPPVGESRWDLPVTVPGWLYRAVLDLVSEQMDKKGRGRTGNHLAQLKQHRIHLVRWGTVKHLRENCRERARTWPDAYAEASRELRGTDAQGSPGAMEASYKHHCRNPYNRAITDKGKHAREIYERRDALLAPVG
jgi:hypothetical protein